MCSAEPSAAALNGFPLGVLLSMLPSLVMDFLSVEDTAAVYGVNAMLKTISKQHARFDNFTSFKYDLPKVKSDRVHAFSARYVAYGYTASGCALYPVLSGSYRSDTPKRRNANLQQCLLTLLANVAVTRRYPNARAIQLSSRRSRPQAEAVADTTPEALAEVKECFPQLTGLVLWDCEYSCHMRCSQTKAA
jgi:hypothetical protein